MASPLTPRTYRPSPPVVRRSDLAAGGSGPTSGPIGRGPDPRSDPDGSITVPTGPPSGTGTTRRSRRASASGTVPITTGAAGDRSGTAPPGLEGERRGGAPRPTEPGDDPLARLRPPPFEPWPERARRWVSDRVPIAGGAAGDRAAGFGRVPFDRLAATRGASAVAHAGEEPGAGDWSRVVSSGDGLGPGRRNGWSRHLVPLLAVVVAAAVAWWLLRPPPGPLETVLPVAGAGEGPPAGAPADGAGSGNGTGQPGSPPAGAGAGAGTRSGAAEATGAGGTAPPPTEAVLVVQAAGAVAVPGVYRLPAGARVDDLVRAAGGLAADADPDRVNLAAPLADGERVWVPRRGEVDVPVVVGGGGVPRPSGAGADGGGTGGDSGPPDIVDLNTATAEELDTLPGVGPATAAAILAYRDGNGPFGSVDELLEVRGIGEAKLEQLRPLVRV